MCPERNQPHPAAAARAVKPPDLPGRGLAGRHIGPVEDYGVPVREMRPPGTNVHGIGLTTGSVLLDRSLSKIFVAAYLLTGSEKQAECLVLESIRGLDIQSFRNGRLSWKALDAAIAWEGAGSEHAAGAAPSMRLPVELARVLRLSPRLRQCFVLRFLMAMPPAYCAGLLRLETEQVDANCALAARELAKMGHAKGGTTCPGTPIEVRCTGRKVDGAYAGKR